MAANSSGVEWGSIVKPILAASYGSFNKNDITELAKAIIRSESELMSHDEKYETFYTAFSALAADYISFSATSVCKSQLGIVCSACCILLRYLLSRLSAQGGNADQNAPNTLPTKQLLLPIKALCSATSMLARSDQIALTAIMKNAKLPPHIKTSMPGENVSGEMKEAKEGKVRSRADLSNQIMEQLTSPLLDYSLPRSASVETPEGKPSDSINDKSYEIENAFIHRNIASLKSLGAGDVMIEMCLQLPHLARYIHKYNMAISKKGFSLPCTFSEAQLIRLSLQAVVGDMSVVWSALSLPVLEPLTPARLKKLTTITMTCLYCALSAATAASVYGASSTVSPKTVPTSSSGGNTGKQGEEESNADALATTVVEKALEIFNLMSFIIKSSTRTGGNVLQNHMLIGAWLLISGLQAQLSASSQVPSDKPGKEDKGKSPSKCREGSSRINLMKVQQGFGVLSVALASRALLLMGELLEDAQFEAMDSVATVEHAELNILAHSTALQRAVTILNAAPINQFLFYLATVSYRKACTLKRIQKHPPEGDTFSTSDSTTYYEDEMSCSDESSPDVDDDSEPLLGLWFEETISVPDCDTSNNTQSQESQEPPTKPTTIPTSSVVPEKGEPNGFILLASQIFQVMNKYLVTSESGYLMRYIETGLSEQQMVMLAAIIRDLDRETARTDTGTISVYFGPTLGHLYSEFSHALTQYTHNLLARNLLSESLKSTLLLHLGVNPFSSNADSKTWPLQVYTRTLAVLAQVLLLKPQLEKETACIIIWQRLISTLVDNIRMNSTTVEIENEDLNVEHAQLVLFLFHSLNLMQKKSVLLLCASAVVSVADNFRTSASLRETQLLHLSRLLLLLDYLIRHLYDAPAALLEQVQWNLLSGTSLISENGEESVVSRVFCPCSEIEDNYRKVMPHDEFSMRPRFYSLTYGELNNQEPPKLDGLACNFILGTPDKVKYPELIDALIDILNVTEQCTPAIRSTDKISFTSLCAIQYTFMTSWRMLLQLPPSTPYLEKLAQGNKVDATPLLLHSLVWGPRTAHKTFIPWMKDCLVKQGMYTQYAEAALTNVAEVVNNLRYDINLAKHCISLLTPQIEATGWLVPKRDLPSIMNLCILDAMVAKVQALSEHQGKSTGTDSESNKTIQPIEIKPQADLVQELLPHLLQLSEIILVCTRSSLMYQISEDEGGSNYTNGDLSAFCSVLAICSTRGAKTQVLATSITQLLPSPVTSALEKWNANAITSFPWNEYANDIIPGESCVMYLVMLHISSLSAHNTFTINPSLKHLLHSLVSFISDHISKCNEGNAIWQQAVTVLAPLTLDACTDYLHDTALRTLEKAIGDPESDKHQATIYSLVLRHIYTLILNYTGATSPCSDAVNEKILHECLLWMEFLLEKAPGRQALDKFFDNSPERDLVQILLSVASPRTSLSTTYGTRVLQFFNKLFNIAEKNPGDEGLERLCASLLRLANVEPSVLSGWLHHVILGTGSSTTKGESSSSSHAPGESSPPIVTLGISTNNSTGSETKTDKAPTESTPPSSNSSSKDKKTLFQENQLLLQYLTAYIVKQNSGSEAKEVVAVTLLEALVPMASQLLSSCQGTGFPQLMIVMSTLADAGSGRGHVTLFTAATEWIHICKDLCEKEVVGNMELRNTTSSLVESSCYLLNYMGDIVRALCPPSPARATSPPWEGEPILLPDPEIDWLDDLTHDDDDESGGDESDEDSLCNKLCTFTITQKEFMNQHWYHCHTCKMVDGVGVCSVCARVCHRGHDVTYAKFGNFFCDCGARENGTCQALTKRSAQSGNADTGHQGGPSTSGSASGMEHMLTSSLRRRPSSPSLDRSQQQRDQAKHAALSKLLEPLMEPLVSLVNKESSLVAPLVSLVKALLPAIEASCQRNSPVGCHHRSQTALKQLHVVDKRFVPTDQLMVPTLGSQEGAFENVRMNYSGEQGQTIRQLMSAHMIRRVAMCCLASPFGKRQHLAVSHEKGKITVLQLSALLKQADSSKRKLTLTRLSSAPIPFTVLSITGNQLNEDFLAVCGLKDCHVLTFTSGGSVADHLVLHPQLETGNFIIRAVWLPGSQTKLALVTADFVKIYDLSHDVLSPQYYFLVPTGKIRDVTFACAEEGKSNMLLMSSTGYVYVQDMNEQSSAKHGPFYVTNTLEMYHPEIKESNGQVCGGGVSIYYSHTLRLLFYSYAQGKSFIAPLECGETTISPVFQINLGRSTGNSSGGSNKGGSGGSNQPQPLCQWSEVPNHPGLICSVLQTSNNPVILMIKPDTVLVQEIKVVPAKAKIMDMVAIRHPSSNSDHRTTLILLCEDGSLRIYMASMDQTGFWLSPSMQAVSAAPHKSCKKKKTGAKTGKPPGTVAFPVDFFEHSNQMNDVEFGGNDLLQIYNAQQIKHRLNTTGMYVASTKTAGFNVEIMNNDPTHVITGIRVLVGNQDTQRVPAYIEVGGRSIPTTVTRNRWFDFPLTREESLQADKKLTVTFGPSQDPDGITMVDSIKVYGKTKDLFGWPEETEEVASATTNTTQAVPSTNIDSESTNMTPPPMSSLDRMVSGILEVLDGCFTLMSSCDDKNQLRPVAVSLATTLLTLPTATCIQLQTKSLLAALHQTRQAYHNYKDQAVLNYVLTSLGALRQIPDSRDLDTEAFYRLVLMARAIAVARPNNLVKYSQPPEGSSTSDAGQKNHLVVQFVDILWRLHSAQPRNFALASVCIPGLRHVEGTVYSLVEIVHAFTVAEHSETMTTLAARIYLDLLLCQDTTVSFSAKHAIIRVLKPRIKKRRVFIPSPPHCSTPGAAECDKPGPISQPSQDSSEAEPNQFDETVESVVLLAPDPGAVSSGVSVNVEALLGGVGAGGGFPPMLDIPPDADDETMVELAIALSLQDHEGTPNLHGLVNLQALQNLAGPALQAIAGGQVNLGGGQNQEAGHYSDTTASAGGSDDEGSTAATDGSTLRTSPADQGGSGGSESGGSGVESITGEHNVSGRSSAYGDNMQEALAGARSETSSLGAPAGFQNQEPDGLEAEADVEPEGGKTLHALRLATLERLVQHVPQVQSIGGVTAIPFMQVVLMLTSDLDGEEERGRACLESLLNAVLSLLAMNNPDTLEICNRNPQREVQLVIMRLLSVLMSRPKATSKADNSNFVSQTTANMLIQSGIIEYCLTLLKELITYWKSCAQEESNISVGGTLLKPHLPSSPPDMSPFFLRQYVKGHATDVFEMYPQLLTEMALRLPYQVQKHTPNHINFSQSWFFYLCEYMMTQQTPFVRRQVRKLLLFICGNKEKYRQLRDLHSLESHMKAVKNCLEGTGVRLPLSYDALVELVEHLKACVEVGTSRTSNWRQFCMKDSSVLAFLMQASCVLDEAVAQTTLQLLQCAICPAKQVATPPQSNTQESKPGPSSRGSSKEKIDDSETEDAQCLALVRQLNGKVPRDLFTRFMRTFLLETNASNMRWQAHALVLAIYRNSEVQEQEAILDQLWSLWPQLPSYGRKASQFVDLLGFFSIKSSMAHDKVGDFIEQAVNMLRTQNQVLSLHPNATLYNQLAQYVELEGFYLESDPCLVCNNPELPLTNIKLSSIKIDSKFTTTTQIVKLVSSHTISKITLRISDLKRTKMVRTMNIYYNNRSVQAVVELKNKPAMWHKAKKVSLNSGQTEVKVEFPLPIVACNLMIEYADFYENLQASSETLQCPRCSSSVPANPGVCANCGENVFQCHKCRAINYDEKDPFLCHACGFCKYAKFDFTLTGRQCCAVDPIENDEDRKKTIAAINSHLEKADRVYKQLIGNKPTLEMLLLKICEHRSERGIDEVSVQTGGTGGGSGTSVVSSVMVNRAIQLLAQRYCTDCKTSFEELSRIIQKVLACRRKLVAYDRSQLEQSGQVGMTSSLANIDLSEGALQAPYQGKCYGCASSATEHCLILLRALANNHETRQILCGQGLIQELVENNLRRGTTQVQEDVRQLICLVTGDNSIATQEMCTMLMERIAVTLRGHTANSELAAAVRPEMSLLAALVRKEDSCWEQKLRCVMHLFLMACSEGKSPVVMESITLPCLKILQGLIKPEQANSKKYKDKTLEVIATIRATDGVLVDVQKWLQGDPQHSFKAWQKRMPKRQTDSPPTSKPQSKTEARAIYLQEKYFRKWRERLIQPLKLTEAAWLKEILFNPSSSLARQVTCNMLESLCQAQPRKKEMLDLFTGFLSELGTAGESAAEYFTLYQSLVQQSPWKQYLALKGVLLHLADLLTMEIEAIHRLEGSTLTSDLSQGYALKMLTELMASFLEQPNIKQQYKGRLVGAVLNGYLSLRRLVVQRTRLIDETQDKLLELLEEMTSGTEEETKAFMAICIQTAEKCSPQDVRTPVFVFERLCSIIYPEENDVGEFYLTLEKDPQQEDFLQGRMLGNPYSCNEPGLGPLMRDVKNKICQDCELVALLEDDNGMELLVNNKIISLDLPVKEVYKKIWVAEGGEGDSMRVVYRMRGLLGDATEEFVETLHAKTQQEVNNEEVYKMANVMADCGGLQVILGRLSQIRDTLRSRPLLQVILKLLLLCVKVSKNQEVLCQTELGAVTILLNILELCVSDCTQQTTQLIEQILEITETILSKAASKTLEDYITFSKSLGGVEHISSLLECAVTCPGVRSSTSSALHHLTKVLAALTYANHKKMTVLMDYFRPYPLDFNKFDSEHTPEEAQKLELFCNLAIGIERSALGNTLKDYILSLGIVDQALNYIISHAPLVKPTFLHSDSDEWKEFISKPSLKYILRFLTGLASHHRPTQDAVSVDCITIIHRLEQVSSDEHVGSLAENLLEALCTNECAASRIEEVREQTRAAKKRLAMAMREKQLGALGMRTNDKGQLTVESTIMQQMEDLGEETGLVCVICREGYKFQPTKVLGVYTFTKRCNVEEFENKSRKTIGYSTVTHFNVVHVDCHMSAVRLARARDEWESAALQNANTKCNGLLPLWGPQVPESAFASCLARHNTYLQESTGHRDISYTSTVHDLKLLLLRFSQEKSFHEDAGGGGPQSNMHIIPYLMHMALYVINTTRCGSREAKNLSVFLENGSERRVETCYEAEGPHYWATFSLLLHSPAHWSKTRIEHLKRLILLSHVRHLHPAAPHHLSDTKPKPYTVYKSNLVFFALIDAIYSNHFKKVPFTSEDHWPANLADYVRHNDEALIKASERLMSTYNDELLPCTSFEEFCDVVGLLAEIPNASTYIAEVLATCV